MTDHIYTFLHVDVHRVRVSGGHLPLDPKLYIPLEFGVCIAMCNLASLNGPILVHVDHLL